MTTSFDSLPDLTGATACPQVADVDLSDPEYTLPTPFSLPIQSAETLAAENARLRQALFPFAQAGEVYRQGGAAPGYVALVVEIDSAGRILRVGDFLAAADAIRK